MPQSYSCVLVHFTFSTKDRRPLIDQNIEKELHRFLGGVFRDCDCPALMVGGVEDHIHVLCRLSKTMSQADMMEEAKTRSSKWIKDRWPSHRDFYWQAGYGAFSIGRSQVGAVEKYIVEQREHHRKTTFHEELLALLKKYEVEYDPRYIWDKSSGNVGGSNPISRAKVSLPAKPVLARPCRGLTSLKVSYPGASPGCARLTPG